MIKEILEDNSGGSSSIRIIALLPVVVVSIGWTVAAITRAYVAILAKLPVDLPDIPLEVSAFALGCAGLKVYQRIKGEPTAP